MREPTELFKVQVKLAWGVPRAVADVALNEAFRHDDLCDFDLDDQIRLAKNIGVLAGLTASVGPDEFIRRYAAEIINEEQ